MGVVPPPPPPLYGTAEERRAQLIEYRDHLLAMQSQQPGTGAITFWLIIFFGLWILGGLTIFYG